MQRTGVGQAAGGNVADGPFHDVVSGQLLPPAGLIGIKVTLLTGIVPAIKFRRPGCSRAEEAEGDAVFPVITR